jgi:hypothetical protein
MVCPDVDPAPEAIFRSVCNRRYARRSGSKRSASVGLQDRSKAPAGARARRRCVSATNPGNRALPLKLSLDALAEGWTGLVLTTRSGNVADFGSVLQEQFFDGKAWFG